MCVVSSKFLSRTLHPLPVYWSTWPGKEFHLSGESPSSCQCSIWRTQYVIPPHSITWTMNPDMRSSLQLTRPWLQLDTSCHRREMMERDIQIGLAQSTLLKSRVAIHKLNLSYIDCSMLYTQSVLWFLSYATLFPLNYYFFSLMTHLFSLIIWYYHTITHPPSSQLLLHLMLLLDDLFLLTSPLFHIILSLSLCLSHPSLWTSPRHKEYGI